MRILGISSMFHDASVTVVEDGKILFAAHAERYSKKKNDAFLNREMIRVAAFVAVTLSIVAYAFVGSELGIFVGLWAPTFLLAGQYLLPETH